MLGNSVGVFLETRACGPRRRPRFSASPEPASVGIPTSRSGFGTRALESTRTRPRVLGKPNVNLIFSSRIPGSVPAPSTPARPRVWRAPARLQKYLWNSYLLNLYLAQPPPRREDLGESWARTSGLGLKKSKRWSFDAASMRGAACARRPALGTTVWICVSRVPTRQRSRFQWPSGMIDSSNALDAVTWLSRTLSIAHSSHETSLHPRSKINENSQRNCQPTPALASSIFAFFSSDPFLGTADLTADLTFGEKIEM